jgi:hypothetical protein
MNTIPLFRVVREDVGIADSFTAARSTRIDEPVHVTGHGVTLVGVKQKQRGVIQFALVDGQPAYFEVDLKLREMLEAQLRAEHLLELAQQRAEIVSSFAAGPWWRRVWLALTGSSRAG